MFYLIASMYLTVSGVTTYGQYRWAMPDQAACAVKRDALLAAHGAPGAPPGATRNPYLTDAWCIPADPAAAANR